MSDPVAIEGRGELRQIRNREDGSYDITVNIPSVDVQVAQALMAWVLDEIQFVFVDVTRNPIKGTPKQSGPKNNQVGKKPEVYFVQDDVTNRIKIGYTTNMGSRFSALQTSTPHHLTLLATMPGTRATEAQMQTRFKRLNVEGEWFEADEELLEFIDGIKTE